MKYSSMIYIYKHVLFDKTCKKICRAIELQRNDFQVINKLFTLICQLCQVTNQLINSSTNQTKWHAYFFTF